MREIKFRAWDKNNNEWLYSSRAELLTFYGFAIFGECTLLCTPSIDDLINVEITQYTGLKDENGIEIYEGDIIQFTYWWFDGNVAESNLTGTIVYSDVCMSFQLKGVKNKDWQQHTGHDNDNEYLTPFSELDFEEADFKVIGNIYENPELLTGE